MDIYLSKTVCSNLELDNETIGAYIALRSLYNVNKPIMYVTYNMLCYELFGSAKFTKYFKQSIHNGLVNLINFGLVSVVEEIGKSEYILDLSKLHIGTVNETKEYYQIVTLDEIHKIFNLEGKTDKFALCRYFIQMLSTINFEMGIYIDAIGNEYRNFVGFMTQDYLAQITGITTDSVIVYNDILEKEKLVYIYRHNNYICDNGSIKSFTNHYGRYKDAEYIKKFAMQYEETNGIVSEEAKLVKKKSNNGRSLMQKYNALCNGKDYSVREVEEIYNYVHAKNLALVENVEDEEERFIIAQSMDGYKSEEVFEYYLDENGNFKKDNDPLSIFKAAKGA